MKKQYLNAAFAALVAFILMILPVVLKAQGTGTAAISTNTNVTIPPGQQCTTLRATVTGNLQSTTYTAGQIAYNPPVAFNSGTPVLVHIDDKWSSTISLPFNFCFFGASHNQIAIGANGEVSFNVTNSAAFENWSIPGPIPNANLQNDQRNVIMAPWQDIDPTNHGSIQYNIGGVAPNRYFTASWYDCPMFGDSGSVDNGYCSHLDHQISMVVLYETSNNIDIYIERKDVICTDLSGGTYWNGGLAVEGIVNATGTETVTVPGRNATQWTAYYDAWRFTPAGAPDNITQWYDGTTQVGSGDTLVICPTGPTTYTVQTTLTNCDNSTLTLTDTAHVDISFWFDSTVVVYPDCAHNGRITAVTGGGTAPVTYAWSNGATGALDSNLTAGTYIVTATDNLGHTITDTVVLSDGLILGAGSAVILQPGCLTGGSINLQGAPGLNNTDVFNWSNAATGANISNLSGGSYTVTITDSAGCTASATYVIHQPFPLGVSFPETPPACYGDSSGIIQAIGTGGQPPYTYLWNNGRITATDTGLSYLQYAAVTVTDANGCTFTTADSITQQPMQLYASGVTTPVLCNGQSNGSIDVTVSGGVPPYSYVWSNNSSGPNNTNLSAGNYGLTVVDANGCGVPLLYIVNQPAQLIITSAVVQNACHGNGDITVNVTGGAGAYNYSWAPAVSQTNTATAIPAGYYGLTVTDVNGCFIDGAYIVSGDTAPLQPLCLVTSDSTNTGNFVIWEKTDKAATDSFFIYRSYAADSNYVEVAAIPRDSLSEYDDAGANPTLTSYRYKMNLKDTCGNYSPLSNYIQTIFLQSTGAGSFVWTPYAVENDSTLVGSYVLLYDTSGLGHWMVATGQITDTSGFDQDFGHHPNASYEVQATLNTSCTPTRGISTITSNVILRVPTNIISPTASNVQVKAYPNPFNDVTNVQITGLTGAGNYNFELYDVTGRLQLSIPSGSTNHFQINRGKLAAGVYTYRLVIGEEGVSAFGKLVIQ